MDAIGRKHWAIAEGYIPSQSSFLDHALISHETACILNAGGSDAHVALTIFFTDRDPVGPYRITVPARRTLHLRFNDLTEPSPIPRDTDFSSVFDSDAPIVVQHTRLDSRHAEVSLMSTTAYSESEVRERPPRCLERAIKSESDDHFEKAFERGRPCARDLGRCLWPDHDFSRCFGA